MSFPHLSAKSKKILIILIFIYILIFLRFVQELEKYQLLSKKSSILIQLRVWQKTEDEAHNCQFSSEMWRLQLKNCQKIKIGDQIEVFGKVGRIPASSLFPKIPLTAQSFSVLAQKRLSVIDQFFIPLQLISEHLTQLSREILEKFPAPQGSLIIGLLFGKADLPKPFKNLLARLGMQHITSVSGYNLGLVMSIFSRLLEPLGSKRLKFTLSLSILLLYLFICGFSFPLLRAAVMFMGFSLARLFFHRQYAGIYGLLLTATGFLAWRPWLLFDLSFQLTIGACLGVMAFSDKIETFIVHRWPRRWRISNPLLQLLKDFFLESWVTTVAAQVFVWPILFAAFGQTSLLAFIANPLLLWLIPVATITGICAIGFFLFLPLPGLKLLASFFAWAPATALVKGIEVWSVLPESFGQLFIQFPWSGVVVWWGSVFFLLAFRPRYHQKLS
jgi:ComEC/Rec2-related protein